jgi:hypothetical protein
MFVLNIIRHRNVELRILVPKFFTEDSNGVLKASITNIQHGFSNDQGKDEYLTRRCINDAPAGKHEILNGETDELIDTGEAKLKYS